MSPAAFHNAVLTLTSAYAEALADLERRAVAAEQERDLIRRARVIAGPRLVAAAKAVIAGDKGAMAELRTAVAELETPP